MENSDTDDENHDRRNQQQQQQHQHSSGRKKQGLRAAKNREYTHISCPKAGGTGATGTSAASLSKRNSSSRRSSAPLPQHASHAKSPRRATEKQPANRRMVERSHSDKVRGHQQGPSRTGSRQPPVPSSSPRPRSAYHLPSVRSSSPRLSLDEADSEHKKIRWETPTTHRYQLAEQPRLLEEKFLNVLDSANMICSPSFDKPMLGGSVWNLLEANKNFVQFSERNRNAGTETNDSNSQGQSSDDDSAEESVFEDGPSVVEITANPPVFSESITASESLLSTSQDSEDENDYGRIDGSNRRHTATKKQIRNESRDNPGAAPADSSQILDDLSGMESERKIIEYDNAPHKLGHEQPIVVSNDDRPPVKIYSTSMPFEPTKEKQCILSMGKLQDMHKARSDSVAAKKQYEANRREHEALRRKLKESPHIPPIPDISVGVSNEVSTMSASEDSYMYQRKSKRSLYGRNQDRVTTQVGVIPENRGLHIEYNNTKLLFDDSFQDETRSCIPIRLQRKKRGADGATASSSSKSLGLRLLSRSGDANTTSEKENDTDSPYNYEYDSGVNTYVAYFEISKRDMRSTLQVIEHPNPPLLPFGSNEVVVKIDVSSFLYRTKLLLVTKSNTPHFCFACLQASTISQSDCAIRRGEWWGGTLSLPRIPGVAFAGRIDQVHKSGRNSMQRGEQVLSLVCSGSNSRYVCIPRDRLVKVSGNVNQSAAKLACLPEIYLTAFQILHVNQSNGSRYRKNSLSGKSVMFVGGATALGQAIIELGVEAGASVVYATATKVKQFQRIIEMGGIPLSDNPAEWLPSINQQIDVLIGCTSDTLKDTDLLTYDHLNVLKKKGQLILLGGAGAPNDYPVIHPGKAQCQVDVFKILKRAIKHNVFENWENDMKQGKRDLAHLIGLMNKGVLNPKILERISLSKVSKAEEIVEARRLHGVIVCEPWIQEKQR